MGVLTTLCMILLLLKVKLDRALVDNDFLTIEETNVSPKIIVSSSPTITEPTKTTMHNLAYSPITSPSLEVINESCHLEELIDRSSVVPSKEDVSVILGDMSNCDDDDIVDFFLGIVKRYGEKTSNIQITDTEIVGRMKLERSVQDLQGIASIVLLNANVQRNTLEK